MIGTPGSHQLQPPQQGLWITRSRRLFCTEQAIGISREGWRTFAVRHGRQGCQPPERRQPRSATQANQSQPGERRTQKPHSAPQTTRQLKMRRLWREGFIQRNVGSNTGCNVRRDRRLTDRRFVWECFRWRDRPAIFRCCSLHGLILQHWSGLRFRFDRWLNKRRVNLLHI